jgi:hypothetical protein
MRNVFLIAGAAALAMSMPALAEKGGKGGGNNGGGGKGQAAQAQGNGGGGNKAARGGGGGGGQAKAARQAPQQRQEARGGGGPKFQPAKAERQAYKAPKAERQAFRADKPVKADRNFERQARRDSRGGQEMVRVNTGRDRVIDGRTYYNDGDDRYAAAGQNCPPGLAKKGNGCLPPGQAKKAFGMGDRVQQAWFGGYNVPAAYSAFYQDTPQYYYRHDDGGYIYRVDRQSDLISGLVPLLGGGFAVGQPLPAGYDVYNVPYQYRDDYYDTDEANYRYGDDAIYQVDPQSGMIESIVALLAGDLNVGQQLPAGYDVYNVPTEYRDEYYDTEDHDYRYADGNIYQVDTKTQIIQAIVQMLV